MRIPAVLAILALAPLTSLAAQAQAPGGGDLYTLCAFYPQASACGPVYQQALTDTSSPASGAVRDAFHFYARYLKMPASGLTDQDRSWLKDSGIDLPADLDAADLSGLHNVINDPEFAADAEAKGRAVNNFITRAIEAELYCGLSTCEAAAKPSGA